MSGGQRARRVKSVGLTAKGIAVRCEGIRGLIDQVCLVFTARYSLMPGHAPCLSGRGFGINYFDIRGICLPSQQPSIKRNGHFVACVETSRSKAMGFCKRRT